MQRLALFFLSASLLATACQKEKVERSTVETEAAPSQQDQSAQDEPQKSEPANTEPIVTCDSLGIPSYDFLIRDLSALRCESCHNDKLAFNGIKFLTYENYQTYAVQAKARIETNMLTKPLDVIEQGIFLDWFNNGMPRTEKDCQNKS